ncbi:MAG: acylneuraminate cytidylyltransferase family protein [bacterium]|nr:acylneuraminate cytidylyltransferase family protein [bacterium]MDZ4285092.1 acylneuraminate cytidylyltransferase family protein [Patescibacteria group bacterium]
MNPYILAVIPARGGSKSVPRKNIKPLGGVPLLAHMLRSALASSSLSRVVVSSEDEEVLDIAASLGGREVALRRPVELALDTTPDVPMLQHATSEIEREMGRAVDYVVQLHATTPFLTAADIDEALEMLVARREADSIVSVYEVRDFHPVKMKRVRADGFLEQYVSGTEELTTSRRQDFESVYKRNGGLYAARRSVVMELGRVWGEKVLPYIMPHERSVDINSATDFLVAEAIYRSLKERGEL